MPALLGLLGTTGTGLAIAPALRVLTYPFRALTAIALGRGWYLQLSHSASTVWQRRSRLVLSISTVVAATLWALRFAGILGMRPF